MEIAAYPVPYIAPPTPQVVDLKSSNGARSDLQSRSGNSNTPSERVLQGEVLDGRRPTADVSAEERYNFEQRARREQPDLSALPPESQVAIRSYLENTDINALIYNTRSLIDVYA